MRSSSDDKNVATTRTLLDDAAVEALLRGDCVPPELEPLAEVVDFVRAVASSPVQPSPLLAECMATGVFRAPESAAINRRRGAHASRKPSTVVRSRLARMSFRTKVAAGLAASLSGVSLATATGALPDAAEQRARTVIEQVTPIDFPDSAGFGQEVSDDAQDGGVDGAEVSERARQKSDDVPAPTTPDPSNESGPRGQAKGDRADPSGVLPNPDVPRAKHSDGPPDRSESKDRAPKPTPG